jgi:hypothetical protein
MRERDNWKRHGDGRCGGNILVLLACFDIESATSLLFSVG